MNVAAILKQKGREVFTTTPDTTLFDITKLLGLHGIGCVVITGIEGKVVGIVSERDVVREIARAGSRSPQGAGRDLHDQDRGDLP